MRIPRLPATSRCALRLAIALMLSQPMWSAGVADWPMWRCDANRTAHSPEDLPARLAPLWARAYAPRVPAWEDPLNQDLMSFDAVFEPVVLGDRMFLPFNDRDKLIALDIRSGRELWAFYADGPVRLAPAAAQGRVYFVSDDGCLYCLRAEDGRLEWKFRGAPSDRKVLGNRRLVSAWPARGGPVIRDGVVYFAASIWPFMGTFIHALDAATGKPIWTNDGTGADFIKQPHNAPAFGGVAPQGALVATEQFLLVPGGRSSPAALERATGRLLYFRIAESGKGTGGSTVMADEKDFFVHTRGRGTRAHELATGAKSSLALDEPVLAQNHYYCGADHPHARGPLTDAEAKLAAARYGELRARGTLSDARDTGDNTSIQRATAALESAAKKALLAQDVVARARQGVSGNQLKRVVQAWRADQSLEWEIEADGSGDVIRAGARLYAGGEGTIAAINVPKPAAQPSIAWSLPLEGHVGRLLAARGMLFAVTREGRILAFGDGSKSAPTTIKEQPRAATPAPAATSTAGDIVSRSGARGGYAICLGLDDPSTITALAASSSLHIIGVDPDASKVDRLRRELDAVGTYGTRVALLPAAPDTSGAPPYIANLAIVGTTFTAGLSEPAALRKTYESIRPYGGSLWFISPRDATGLAARIRSADLPNAKVEIAGPHIRVIREGALPGTADWTHQYGDAANSLKSDDRTIKPPLGILWFGGNTHMDVLPRHGHGPSEQVVGGRLFLEGMDRLCARDVYTGRQLWKTTVPDLDTRGIYHDGTYVADPLTTLYNQRHIPGANARGANFVATADSVYVAVSNRCTVLDAATGHIGMTVTMPSSPERPAPEWAYLAVCDDVLLGGTGFAYFNRRFAQPTLESLVGMADYAASTGLAAFDRHTGRQLWRTDAHHSFIHNGIAAGGGRIYCLDRLPRSAETKAARRGYAPGTYRIAAFDQRTGRQLWENTNAVFGTWLSYSKEHDLLLQAGASATDRLKDEATQGMAVLRAKDGTEVWRDDSLKYNGPCILYHGLILTTPGSYRQSAGAFGLLDGKPHCITNPLTGDLQPWRVYRTYGCNTPVASEYLMTFRSGAAGFYDLARHGGTGNLGGFKSGCSANLIVADGVLNAPDYTRTCSCPYQNQTSLALVPMPEAELWTCNLSGLDTPAGRRVRRIGLNLGAPGDRIDDAGTLWLEYPPSPGISPRLPVAIQPDNVSPFRHHASTVSGEGPTWIFASGLRDIESVKISPRTLKTEAVPSSASDSEEEDAAGKSAPKKDPARTAPIADPPPIRMAPARYTVRLYFLEPDPVAPGQRIFDVLLQGHSALTGFDIVKAGGACDSGIVREFKGVDVGDELDVRLQKSRASRLGPVLSGVELILE
ncbi:MAG TPA: PQQ-binding-like beta-propeller repeat protein [Verrucomicrobiae bacterium]|nr:PQQ-binding-like beta-propeller repeat protein [Verrucomicrobiae bacterium]